jgi:DNA invertase Pin-like site-specific DNA recombinase
MLMVTRLDRLVQTTRDLVNTLAQIADERAGFRSLAAASADTTTSHARLMLTVLGGLVEFERDIVRSRTTEGRERAKARGEKLGRSPKLPPHQIKDAINRRDAGKPTREIARMFSVSHSTNSRLS